MTKEGMVYKLMEIGVDVNSVIIEPAKKVYKRGEENTVGCYSRELKQDLWIHDSFSNDMYCLKACWKDREQYPIETFKGGKKYQVPLADFIPYKSLEQSITEKVYRIPTLDTETRITYTPLKTIDRPTLVSTKEVKNVIDQNCKEGIFVGDVLTEESPEMTEYKKLLTETARNLKSPETISYKDEKVDFEVITIGAWNITIPTELMDRISITLDVSGMDKEKLQSIVDIINS